MELNFFGKFFLISYFFALSVTSPITSNEENEKLLKKSREMRSFMNENIDPCENFYEFACGNWANIYPADNDMETSYVLLAKKAFEKKAIALLTADTDSIDTSIAKNAKNFYKSCMKVTDGVKRDKLFSIYSEFGEMPALAGLTTAQKSPLYKYFYWDEPQYDWLGTLAKIKQKYDFPYIIGLEISVDLRDKSKNRVYIGEADFDLESKSIYLDDVGSEYRELYKKAIALKLINLLDMPVYNALRTSADIVNFEISLAEGMLEKKIEKKYSSLLFNTTVEKMHQKYAPTIDIKRFLNITLGEIPTEMIYEYSPNYMLNLKNVIEKTKKTTIMNYIFYHLIEKFSMNKADTEEKLSKICFEKVQEQFPEYIHNMVYRSFDNKAAEKDILRIWNEVKSVFKANFESNTKLNWLTNTTRQKAMEKFDAHTLQINSFMDYDFDKNFKGLEINKNDYVENLKNIMIFKTKRNRALLHGPITTSLEDEIKAILFSPGNILKENTIKIPVANLQPYFLWAENFPDALKFSITGFLLAHELMHAFDEIGRQFGINGTLEEWWDEESVKEFKKRRECFDEQYVDYISKYRTLTRTEFQTESIADNSGLKLAYNAYINLLGTNHTKTTDEMLGLNYTNKQLFFIGYAQLFCSDLRTPLKELKYEIDQHPPAEFRTIGTVSNLVEFAEAFKCKVGSKMNPLKKCEMFLSKY